MARVGRFANYLRGILPCTDNLVTEMTAKAIGCLALAEGAYTAEYVEFEVRRALEWLSTDKNENKRLAAVSYSAIKLPEWLRSQSGCQLFWIA